MYKEVNISHFGSRFLLWRNRDPDFSCGEMFTPHCYFYCICRQKALFGGLAAEPHLLRALPDFVCHLLSLPLLFRWALVEDISCRVDRKVGVAGMRSGLLFNLKTFGKNEI